MSMNLDQLAQGVASGTVTRRRALGVLAAAVVGATVPFARAEAVPACREAGHPCEGNQDCCDPLVCRVTGPGNAKRCAEPKNNNNENKCNKKCKTDEDCNGGKKNTCKYCKKEKNQKYGKCKKKNHSS